MHFTSTCVNSGVFPNASSNKLSGWRCCFCLCAPSIHRLTSLLRVHTGWTQPYTSSHLHTFAEMGDLAAVLMPGIHACTHAYRKHFRKLCAHIYISMCKESLCSVSSRAESLMYIFLCYTLQCVRLSFYLELIYGFGLCGFSVLHTSPVRTSYTFVLTTQGKKKMHICRFFILPSASERQCNKHFHSRVGVYSHSAHIDRHYVEP